jgi:ribosomal protein L11 methyltransferase
VAGDRVLDVGTGSGILALAAIRLGAGSAVALDRSLEACRVARGNVGGNGLQQVIEVIAGTPAALGGSAAFDVVVANLDTGDEVAQWLQTLTGHCRERGRVILSGFQVHAEGIMLKAAAAANLGPLSRRTEGQWVCLAFQRVR